MAREGVKKRGPTWWFYYAAPDPETGRSKKRWERAVAAGYPNTEAGAAQARRARLKAIDEGAPGHSTRATVSELVAEWITGRTHVKPSSIASYREWQRLYIDPLIGQHPARTLTRDDVQHWHQQLLSETPRTIMSPRGVARSVTRALTPKTVAAAHSLLSFALGDAAARHLIPANVARLVPAPAAPPMPRRVWSDAELRRFTAAVAGTDDGAFWIVMALTGMRIGELVVLRWSEVDLRRARLFVQQGLSRDLDLRPMLSTPKSSASARHITLPVEAVQALRDRRDRQTFQRRDAALGWHEQGYVFTDDAGDRLQPETLRRRLKRLLLRLGLPVLTPHGLRHTHGTLLMEEGVSPKVAQERLGHASVAITLGMYTHVSQAMQEDAASRISRLLQRPDDDDDADAAGSTGGSAVF